MVTDIILKILIANLLNKYSGLEISNILNKEINKLTKLRNFNNVDLIVNVMKYLNEYEELV